MILMALISELYELHSVITLWYWICFPFKDFKTVKCS